MIITLYQNKYSKSNRVNYLPTQLRYLWSGAYRCESRSTWSIDRQVTRNNRWGSFILTHNPTKFDYHWHWETGMHLFADTMWLHDRWVAWLDVCSQLKSHFTKIGGHWPSEGRGKAFFWYYLITWSMIHVTRWVR